MPDQQAPLAIVQDYAGLVDAIRARIAEINVGMESVDYVRRIAAQILLSSC